MGHLVGTTSTDVTTLGSIGAGRIRADALVVTTPLSAVDQVPPAPLAGTVALDEHRATTSGLTQQHLAGYPVVKVPDTVHSDATGALTRPPAAPSAAPCRSPATTPRPRRSIPAEALAPGGRSGWAGAVTHAQTACDHTSAFAPASAGDEPGSSAGWAGRLGPRGRVSVMLLRYEVSPSEAGMVVDQLVGAGFAASEENQALGSEVVVVAVDGVSDAQVNDVREVVSRMATVVRPLVAE